MRIHNVRVGLANNSSSTHSIVLMPPDRLPEVQTDEYWDFGWQHFTAADRTSKENYLGYLVHSTLIDLIGNSNADIVTDALFSARGKRTGAEAYDVPFSKALKTNGYGIDHQSRLILPANWNGKGADLWFFEDLRRYFLENPVVILGGNDNDGDEHPLAGEGRGIDFGLPEDGLATPDLVARKDTVDGKAHWVLFNRRTGAKVRLTFDSYPTENISHNPKNEAAIRADKFMQGPQKPVPKAEVPELVDVKVTGFCPAGCKFCYQGSGPNGVHARTQDLYSLVYRLAEMRVFEAALGGGEPTLHPDFPDLLRTFRSYGIVPNFSTRSLAWMGHRNAGQIAETCGSFAYSVSTGKDVKALARALHRAGLDSLLDDRDKVAVQYVLNTGGDLYGVLEEARKSLNYTRVTILGFKRVGLGKDFREVPEDWVSTVERVRKEHSCVPIGVDTLVVQRHGEELRGKLGVQEALMTGEEGKFSMYIDAVSGMMGPSSYCDPSLMVPLLEKGTTEADRIRREFQKW